MRGEADQAAAMDCKVRWIRARIKKINLKNGCGCILTCENHNVNVIFDNLKLVGDPQIAVDILLPQPGEFPAVQIPKTKLTF